MMTETIEPKKKGWVRQWGIPLGVGAVSGFLATFVTLQFIDSDTIGGLPLSNEIAILVAIIYGLTALAVLIGMASPALGEKFLNVEDADELREQRAMLLYSGVAMALWALALAVLALSGPGAPLAAGPALAVALVAMVVGLGLAIRSYRYQDELMSAVNQEATALSYFLTFGIVGTWATLAHVGFVTGPAPLDLLTIFYIVALLATFIAAGRRGMLNQRG